MAGERSGVDNYDVFINFRGADTRHGFVYRLYEDLVAEGIRVFLDDEELNYGKRLDEELPQAINNSKIYITVISETYASSKWCLRELAEIVRNKQQFKEKKEILPIFYKIKTDDVKLKTDLFKDQLNNLINKNVTAQTVEEWGVALKGIPNLKAWTVPIHGGYKEDAECLRDIVKRTSIILRVKHKPMPKDLIGIENPVKEVMRLLDIGNPSLLIIGIHGMGGSGKTTLAKAVYNKLCDRFDYCCFLHNVRESLDNDRGSRGCLELQKKLLYEISYRKDRDEITDMDEAVRRIQLTLRWKNVLMVFDDVSKSKQIVRLIGDNYTMFGRESRIIITTRDDRVLGNREFEDFTKIHEMKAMEKHHALELFSWHAFGKPIPPMEYSLTSNNVVSLTGRLPLSLEIIGSLLYRRKNWEQIVDKLKKMPNQDVQERLKISYEDLNEQSREVFLDIACFFVDKKKSFEIAMWDACDFFPELAIEELISMCLIKIEDNDKFWMHDHIKDLGREIVRQEGPKDIEQRSRIWNKEDSIDILTTSMKKKNNKIEGILLEDVNGDDQMWTLRGENFANLNMLRFLHLEGSMSPGVFTGPSTNMEIEGSFKNLLKKLRWLSLQCMKINRFSATNFNLNKLVVLNFSYSDIIESWGGWKEFKELHCLEVLNLSHCGGLKKTPNLSGYTSLKVLLLSHCAHLEEIDDSIRSLPKLVHLDLSNCGRLEKLPYSIGELLELEVLLLGSCYNMVSLPNTVTSLSKLHILNVSSCKSLESLPDSAGEMVQLKQLDISNLVFRKKLPGFIFKQTNLELLVASFVCMQGIIPTEIGELTCLREINFNESSIGGLPSLVKLTCLKKLSLMECNYLQQLPVQLPASLVQLHVSSKSLQTIPDYSNLSNLTHLILQLFDNWSKDSNVVVELQELDVNWIWRLSKLKKLRLSLSPTSYTTTIQIEESSSAHLEQITLRCSVLGTCVMPTFLYALRKLEIALYMGTTSISLPELKCLTHFVLSDSGDLTQILGLGELESLVSLTITGCKSFERLDDISNLRQLLILHILDCKKLRVISIVPCVQSLKELVIIRCESFESLVGLSESNLDYLHLVERWKIVSCPLLENKLAEEKKR